VIWIPGRRAAPLLALAAGALAAVAHPPFGVLPGLLGFALLLHLVDQTVGEKAYRRAFWRGWLAAFAYFAIGCWWVAEAFLVDAEGQGWMAPIAVTLIPAGLGVFWGAASALYRWLRPQGAWRVLTFAGLMAAAEWLRGNIFTGFPWNLVGETWMAGSPPSQFASVVGAYGLTWITLAIAAAFAIPFGGATRRQWMGAVGASVAALAGLYLYGWARTPIPITPVAGQRPPVIRIVQADVDQEKKYDEAQFRSITERYVRLSARPAEVTPDIIVWPEGAIPDSANAVLAPGSWSAEAIAGALKPGQTLMMGSYRIDGGDSGEPRYFNSLVALHREPAQMRVTGLYDKYHLVPFGEFLPFEPVMAAIGLKKLTRVGDGFTPGPRPHPISPAGAFAVQPLICYEALFPALVREAVNDAVIKPLLLVNVSNDAWFGATSGPWQHLNLASYRSIETGLPMVRATPTGVSAMIDAYGRSDPRQRLVLGKMGVIDATLPPALQSTPYRRLGEWPFLALMGISLLTALPRLLGRRSVSTAVP
jgi:apolipoprotein N-acyltransferase